MATIIVVTDFSASAENALRYACSFVGQRGGVELLLLNIFAVPPSYSGEGVSLAAVGEAIGENENQLRDEFDWISREFPGVKINYKELIGDFVERLQQEVDEQQSPLVIMGTPDNYGDLRLWGPDILNALTSLPVPVLTIPAGVSYRKIAHIAFACIMENISSRTPVEAIQKLVDFTGARLHVVEVVPPEEPGEAGRQGEAILRNRLPEPPAFYHKLAEKHVVEAIGHFVAEQHIDLLLVRPRKHGVWYNLFHKSYSKELARLNLIPVMALHEKWDIN